MEEQRRHALPQQPPYRQDTTSHQHYPRTYTPSPDTTSTRHFPSYMHAMPTSLNIVSTEGSLLAAPDGTAIGHCVDNRVTLNTGIGIQLSLLYPHIKEAYAESNPGAPSCHSCGAIDLNQRRLRTYISERGPIFALLVKTAVRPSRIDPDALASALMAMRATSNHLGITSIALPAMGKSFPEKSHIQALIYDAFKGTNMTITIYHLPKDTSSVQMERDARWQASIKRHFSTLPTHIRHTHTK